MQEPKFDGKNDVQNQLAQGFCEGIAEGAIPDIGGLLAMASLLYKAEYSTEEEMKVILQGFISGLINEQ